eukprot:scaffold48142_cov17-Tisochrysis_lutea.AAC.2
MSWAIEQAGLKDAGKAGMRWAGNKLDSSLGSGKAGQRHRLMRVEQVSSSMHRAGEDAQEDGKACARAQHEHAQ